MILARVYVGTQFDADGKALDPHEVARHLQDFEVHLAHRYGGVTVTWGTGRSAECLAGERTVVYETLMATEGDYMDLTNHAIILRDLLRQGSVLTVKFTVDAHFN